MAARRFDEFEIGDRATLVRTIDAADVERFVTLTGDDNPVHVNDGYARQMGLPARVVHGMLTSGFISTLIGTQLPGPGALWVSERFNFRAPVFVGDEIRVEGIVRRKSVGTRTLVLQLSVRNQRERIVLDGEANVQVLEEVPAMTAPDEARTAVVTGSGRGIGAAIATRLASAGFAVTVNFRADEARAAETVERILTAGGTASAFRADVSDPDQAAALLEHAAETYGPVDALVNNAGGGSDPRAILDTTWADVESHLHGHVRAAFNCVQAVLPSMYERKFGRIVNVTSQYAYGAPPPQQAGYVMAKSALAAFSRSLALEAGPQGVTVNDVAPGMVNTDMVVDVPQRLKAITASKSPIRRLSTIEDVADAVAFLVGPGASAVTGQTLHLSGGQVMA